MKKFLSVAFLIIVFAVSGLFSIASFAKTQKGDLGNNIVWSLDANTGVAHVSGVGRIDRKFRPFGDCSLDIKKLYIDSGITNIPDDFLEGLYMLCELHISDTVVDVKSGLPAFALPVITVAEGNPRYYVSKKCLIDREAKMLLKAMPDFSIPTDGSVISIGSRAFSGLENVSNISIPDCVERFEDYAFYNCAELMSFNVPASLKYVGENVFDETKFYQKNVGAMRKGALYVSNWLLYADRSLSGHYDIKAETVGIASSAFSGCKELTSVSLPVSVRYIGKNAFSFCDRITSIVIPNGVTHIPDFAFYGCDSLSEIILPGSITDFGAHSFSYTKIQSIRIPKGCKRIKTGAFTDCYELKSVEIPASVTGIEKHAFHMCSQLTDIYYAESEECWKNLDIDTVISIISSGGQGTKGDYNYYSSLGYGNAALESATIHYNCAPELKVMVNGVKLETDQPPIIVQGRTLVPMRAIFESIGAVVEWDNPTQTAKGTKGQTTVSVQIGKDILMKNNTPIKLDVPARLINGRTMVPARAIAESFGAIVKWEDKTQTVEIFSE